MIDVDLSVHLGLMVAGVIVFLRAGEFEARDGGANHGVVWAALSLLISVLILFVAGFDTLTWLLAQVGLFVGIAAVRVWLEDREQK